jgi:GNAT superfamily N-acetyltransferase
MLRVRVARPEDAESVARIHVRSWQMGYQGLLPDDYLDRLRPEDRTGHYTFGSLDPQVPHTIIALEGHITRGFATTGPCRDSVQPGTGELFALYVDPDSWGAGVGQLLIRESRGHLLTQGFTEAVLWVLVGNERARRFYRKDGWEADDYVRQDVVWGLRVDESRFRRHLHLQSPDRVSER